jgi:thiosulfate/3-mercaptopyruvate sulfurtransferase
LSAIIMLAILLVFSVAGVQGACPVGGCSAGGESWTASAQAFINSDVPIVGVVSNHNTKSSSFSSRSFQAGQTVGTAINKTVNRTVPTLTGVYVSPGSRADLFPEVGMLKSLDAISEKDVVLDVSNSRSPGEARIRGAVNIPAKSFFYEDGTLRNVSELAAILGGAGISNQDSVMVYSDSFSSGEGTAVLWMLRNLGHEDARTLDGGLDNWIGASLPLVTKENVRSPVSYVPILREEFLADYDFVKSGHAQMVDARSFQEYGKARIGNATFISPESVQKEGRLKPGEELKDTFSRLNASRTAVVYSDDIYRASLVWFALQVMGFDARIFMWQDWEERELEMS